MTKVMGSNELFGVISWLPGACPKKFVAAAPYYHLMHSHLALCHTCNLGLRILGAMPTALRGHETRSPKYDDNLNDVGHMPTQSRGHGTQNPRP